MGIVIYPPTIDWDYMRQRPQQLMWQFAKHKFSVFYYNKIDREGPVISTVEENLHVINHSNFFTQQLYPRLANEQPVLFWSSWSKKLPFASLFNTDLLIYDCVDDFPEWEQEEVDYAAAADIIICTAEHLEEKMRMRLGHKPIYQVKNGCEWSFFANSSQFPQRRPADLPAITGPVIGYIGAWAEWVDEEIIRYVAHKLPHAHIWIIGPSLRRNLKFDEPNIIFFGHQDYKSLPAYLAHVDICIIPFKLNRITRSTNPIKVYEYLAAGKPVVATPLPELSPLKPLVETALTPQQFVKKIKKAWRSRDKYRDTRQQLAKQHSWSRRFLQVNDILREHFPQFRPAPLADAHLLETYHTKYWPLQHCTINSYYSERNLASDPIFVGQSNGYRYECLFKPTEEQLQQLLKRPIHQLYLECNHTLSLSDGQQFELVISAPQQAWSISELTFANCPPVEKICSYHLSDCFNYTLSLELTPYQQRITPFGLHLSATSTCPEPFILQFNTPRLTVIGGIDR